MIGTDIQKAVDFLKQGEVIGLPTETVYGLAGNALNPDAITKIFKVKNRPRFNPLIIHLPNIDALTQYAMIPSEKILQLANRFTPGPLTFLLPKRNNIPDLVTAGSPRVAIRIPRHPLCQAVLSKLDFPVAAPSANPSGYISPTTAQHVAQQLGSKIPYILDGGPCEVGLESTIIGIEDENLVVYRKGGISIEAIESVVGEVAVNTHSSSNPESPGRLSQHYAPAVGIQIGNIARLLPDKDPKKTGILSFSTYYEEVPRTHQYCLSSSGNLDEAAQNLFKGLRYLDNIAGLDLILSELVPEEGLGRAINDRLRRAAAKT